MLDLPIRLIATDIDGTLSNGHGKIPERNIRAIERAREKGIVFAVASGRFAENVYLLMEDCGIRCPVVGTNGARIVDENLKTLSEHRMNPNAARQVVEALIDYGTEYFIFSDRAICIGSQTGVHHSELSQGDRVRALGFTYYHGPDEARALAERCVHKFFITNQKPLEPIREALRGISGIDLTQSAANNIEVMPQGVDKGKGVRDLADLYGIPMSQVMTLGDESNDIPMLKAAGYGVAMGNGSDEAKAAARFITGSNKDCGFAEAIEKYALKE